MTNRSTFFLWRRVFLLTVSKPVRASQMVQGNVQNANEKSVWTVPVAPLIDKFGKIRLLRISCQQLNPFGSLVRLAHFFGIFQSPFGLCTVVSDIQSRTLNRHSSQNDTKLLPKSIDRTRRVAEIAIILYLVSKIHVAVLDIDQQCLHCHLHQNAPYIRCCSNNTMINPILHNPQKIILN